MTQFFVDLVRCRNRTSNLAAQDFAITLSQSMNVRLYCRSRKTCTRRCFIIRGKNAAPGEKALELFEKFELLLGTQFLAQRIERARGARFRPVHSEYPSC